MISVWKRELQSYFYTPIGYLFMGVFLALSSVMFYLQILDQRSSDLLTFIGQISYLWMLLCPVLTMRLLAEERQKRTDQLLLTSPVSLTGIVLGKYLAAVTVMVATVLLTMVYALIVAIYGQVYPGELLVGVAGFILQGCAFIALDLFISGCASTPVSAAVMAFGVNFILWILDMVESSVSIKWLSDVLNFFSLYARNEPFLMGQLSFASIGFDVSFAIACLVMTIHALDSRRYRGA
ncbi:MAG: ABC transporter permease [Clostridia bacterium]|nr:ABC transporter permease [Clostridia bacterium]